MKNGAYIMGPSLNYLLLIETVFQFLPTFAHPLLNYFEEGDFIYKIAQAGLPTPLALNSAPWAKARIMQVCAISSLLNFVSILWLLTSNAVGLEKTSPC